MNTERIVEAAGLGMIWKKVNDGERLGFEDGMTLFECPDLLAVGTIANFFRHKLHGKQTYYVVNQHINYSNICNNGCRFCAFGRSAESPLAFELTVQDMVSKVKERLEEPISEIHIVGGCHPYLPFSFYVDVLKEIAKIRPEAILKAYTPVEIAHFSQLSGLSEGEVLKELKDAGLDVLPGGGAEVFSPRVRSLVCPKKLSGEGWLRIAKMAHRMGIKTNATMLYGHVETKEERLEHLLALRDAQDETNGFLCFIPLSFQPANTALSDIPRPTGIDNLKTIAISRLILDNIPHMKAYWIMLGVKMAQVALHFGADDLDGTIIEEKIGHMAGAQSDKAMTRNELVRVIKEAGFEPVERNTYFEPIQRKYR